MKSQGRGPDSVFADFPRGGEADGEDTSQLDAGGGAGSGEEKGSGDGLLAFILLAIGGGLFALMMPCTYPMIPITISFFTKQADARGGKVLPLSLAYGAGIVLIFVAIGVVVGPVIIRFAIHPLTNLAIGLLFLLFAAVLWCVILVQIFTGLSATPNGRLVKTGGIWLLTTWYSLRTNLVPIVKCICGDMDYLDEFEDEYE